MLDLTEETLAPQVVLRRNLSTTVDVRHGEDGEAPVVGLDHGTVWARAEPDSLGVDLGHGSLNVVVRRGTVLLDAQGGAGLLIVLRGEVEISTGGEERRTAGAGQAVSFDDHGAVSEPGPVDAAELARDPFISLNLVLDSLGGVPITVDGAPPSPAARALFGEGGGPTHETDGAAAGRPGAEPRKRRFRGRRK